MHQTEAIILFGIRRDRAVKVEGKPHEIRRLKQEFMQQANIKRLARDICVKSHNGALYFWRAERSHH